MLDFNISKIGSQIDEQIMAQLEKRGINISNDSANCKNTKKEKPEDKTLQEPPWFQLIKQLGLEPTGSKEDDFKAIAAKIDLLESQAGSQSQKSEVKNIKARFVEICGGTVSDTQQPEKSDLTNTFASLNQLAQLNKFFHVMRQ